MTLQDKAIDIKGKKYVLVSDRIIFFNDNYKNGSITTELISQVESENIVIKATVIPDASNKDRVFTGYSQATKGDGYINKTSALENAETSAVGRALAMLGIGVIDSVASVDEINKTTHQTKANQPAKSILFSKLKKEGITGTEDWQVIKEKIELKSGIVVKSKDEMTEEVARLVVDMWTN